MSRGDLLTPLVIDVCHHDALLGDWSFKGTVWYQVSKEFLNSFKMSEYKIGFAWQCTPCDVMGQDWDLEEEDLRCWNCGDEVTITAKPSLKLPGKDEGGGMS